MATNKDAPYKLNQDRGKMMIKCRVYHCIICKAPGGTLMNTKILSGDGKPQKVKVHKKCYADRLREINLKHMERRHGGGEE